MFVYYSPAAVLSQNAESLGAMAPYDEPSQQLLQQESNGEFCCVIFVKGILIDEIYPTKPNSWNRGEVSVLSLDVETLSVWALNDMGTHSLPTSELIHVDATGYRFNWCKAYQSSPESE